MIPAQEGLFAGHSTECFHENSCEKEIGEPGRLWERPCENMNLEMILLGFVQRCEARWSFVS